MNIRNQLPIPPLRLLEESSPALPEEDANQRNNSVQSHLHRRLLDSGRPTAGLDGGVEVEIAEKPPLQENATIPCDVVSNAHLGDLARPPSRKLPKSTLSTLRTYVCTGHQTCARFGATAESEIVCNDALLASDKLEFPGSSIRR